MKKRLILLAALCALLTACGGTGEAATPEKTYEASAEAPTAAREVSTPPTLDTDEVTRMAIEITWDGSSEYDKGLICMSLDTFGREWAKANLSQGVIANGGDAADLNWDVAVDVLTVKCGEIR